MSAQGAGPRDAAGGTGRGPIVSGLLSAALPGLGQVLSGRARRGVPFLGAFVLLLVLFRPLRLPGSPAGFAGLVLGMTSLCVLSALEAAFGAAAARGGSRPWWIALLLPVWIAAGFAHSWWALQVAGFRVFRTASASMAPTMIPGDLFLADLEWYRHVGVARGDLALVILPGDPSMTFVKRVVGLPGETIEGRGASVLIDGAPLSETYAAWSGPSTGEARDFGPVAIPPGKVFVMGDNRGRSRDSRDSGPVDLTAVKGRMLYGLPWRGDDGGIVVR